MANTNYFHRFVDILRSPMGSPLLSQLAASERKLGELLAYPSVLPNPVPGAPETAQVSKPAGFYSLGQLFQGDLQVTTCATALPK